jgi:hypothetical protein
VKYTIEMIKEIEMPDKEIQLDKGDYVKIYIRVNEIVFDFYCNGDGNSFILTKEELKEMLK